MADPIDWNELLAGGEGAANEALFGAPEWLIRKLGGGANLDAKIAQYKKAHDIGSTVGLVGGSLIPFGGMAKGALGIGAKAARAGEAGLDVARAAKGAETALDLSRAAEAAGDVGKAAELADAARAAGTVAAAAKPAVSLGKTLLDYGAKGAASGALEQGARGYFKDEDAAQIGKDVNQGILFGGLGGAAGGALSKGLGALGKKAPVYSSEFLKKAEQATIGLSPMLKRDTNSALRDIAGPGARGLGRFAKAEEGRSGLSRIIREERLDKIGAEDKYFGQVSKDWKDVRNAFDAANPNMSGKDLIKSSLSRELTSPEIAEIRASPGGLQAEENLMKITEKAASFKGSHNVNKFLRNEIKNADKIPDENEADATRSLLRIIKRGFDDLTADEAQRAGLTVDFDKLRKNYVYDEALANAYARQDMAPLKINTGSGTAEKLGTRQILNTIGGGASGGAAGYILSPGDPEEKKKNALLGALLTGGAGLGGKAIQRIFEKGATSAIAKSGPLAEKLVGAAPRIGASLEKLGAAPGAVATTGARLAANTNRAVQAAAPATEGEATAAQEGADLGQASRDDYMSQVLAKLTDYAKANGVEPDTPDFKDFIRTVGGSTIGEDGQPFDARELAGMFYPDPEERAKFIRALEVSRGIASNLSTALKDTGGVLNTGIGADPNAVMQKSVSLDMLSKLVGEAAEKSGGTAANAKKLLAVALGTKATKAEKRKMIEAIMENYGVDFSTLGRVGLNV
jgi:hypothetical protein